MNAFRALTWDHVRGYDALAAAAECFSPANYGLAISWDKQPLEGFESHPIEDLCERYDLVVLDHPHIGEAVAAGCLQPLEEVFGPAAINDLERVTIGPCLSSYRFAGRHWALPFDAATQVMTVRPDLMDGPPPTIWNDVVALSKTSGKVALCLAGPHAILSYFSIATALGEPPAEGDPDLLVSVETGRQAYELLAELAARSPAAVRDKNPIGILDHMASGDDVVLCPLIYGYVNYAGPGDGGKPIRFSDAPRVRPGGRPGSTLGGTGIGISRRCAVTPELKAHLLWLMGGEAQTQFIPEHNGQPSRRSAWADPGVNAAWDNFYRNTADTLEAAYVRPRHAGYIAFQGKASAYLRDAIAQNETAARAVDAIQKFYAESRPDKGGER